MTDIVIVENPIIDVIAIAQQGPAGPAGVSGDGYVVLIAGSALGGHRAVIDNVTYADHSNSLHAGKVIGITTGSSTTGNPVTIQSGGKLNGFTGLSLGPVYLSTNGTLTQTAPTSGFIQQLGVAVSATEIMIQIHMPIMLLNTVIAVTNHILDTFNNILIDSAGNQSVWQIN